MSAAPLFGIVGWKNAGKTTLVARLVAAFKRRGYRVATIKNAHHAFDIDQPGTDSFRHRAAGASEVVLVSSKRVAIMRELGDAPAPSLFEIAATLTPYDLILVEGFKGETHPKIEVRADSTRGCDGPMLSQFPNIVAVASNQPAADRTTKPHPVPAFDRDDIAAIADFIENHLSLVRPAP